MQPKFWYPCTFQKQGECCPNFDIHFMAWALPGTRKRSQNHVKIHPKSIKNHQKLVLGVALGTPGLPLEASWAPLGARMPKTIKKVTWRTPPRGCQRRSCLSIVRYFLGYCFWYQFFASFIATFWSPWT